MISVRHANKFISWSGTIGILFIYFAIIKTASGIDAGFNTPYKLS
jgi:hypothetical protein